MREKKEESHYMHQGEFWVDNADYSGPERRGDEYYINLKVEVMKNELTNLQSHVDRAVDNILDRIREFQKSSDFKDTENQKAIADLKKLIKEEVERVDIRVNRFSSDLKKYIRGLYKNLEDYKKEATDIIREEIKTEEAKKTRRLVLWLGGLIGASGVSTLFFILKDKIVEIIG